MSDDNQLRPLLLIANIAEGSAKHWGHLAYQFTHFAPVHDCASYLPLEKTR